ncbi:MAG: N-acetylmuramoyl-L-alanine amidase [Deltaproteobacteria bacterium]|nr:N-acetylmuramoyl-L-alanine amidase [Deltaproteobacteria bacterium]
MRPIPPQLRAAFLAASLLLPPFLSLASPRHAAVSGIRFWTNEEYTRVAVDLSDEAKYEANFLRADPESNLPPRIYIDIEDASIREEILRRPVEVRNGLLKVVRAGRFRKGVVRVVIDLERESGYRAFTMTDPFRIIVDIEGKAEAASTEPGGDTPQPHRGGALLQRDTRCKECPPEEMSPVKDGGGSEPRRAGGARIRVMLDPGHGGKDPGAIGPTGLKEKDVVLAIGKMVRERLERHEEFDVKMTRDSDIFIPLEERTAMANEARADIFVSLHINASPNRRAEGISTYVLSRGASDRQALELAARENGVPLAKLTGVKFIIDDLSTSWRKKESLRLAKTVNDAIVRNVNGRFGPVHDLGLKQAPFYVLVGARMTAVLVETSFITNAREEARLRGTSFLAAIADSVVEAVRYYGEKAAVARAGP